MKLTRAKAQQLRLLFAQQDKWQGLKDLAEYAVLNSALTFTASKRSKMQITLCDSELFKLIGEYAARQAEKVEQQVEAIEL